MRSRHGVFVNVLNDDRADWTRQVDAYRHLADLDHVELLCEHELSDGDIDHLKNLLTGLDVTMHAPYLGVSLCVSDDQIRAAGISRVVRAAQRAADLGCAVVTVHSGTVGAWETADAVDHRLLDSLQRIQDRSAVRIALENMPARGGGSREPVAQLDDLHRLLQAMPDLALTLDVGHVLQVGGHPEQWLDELGDSVINMHLHDGIAHGRGHLALNSGELHLDRFIAYLNASGYSGHLALETIGFEDTSLSWKTLRQARRANPAQD